MPLNTAPAAVERGGLPWPPWVDWLLIAVLAVIDWASFGLMTSMADANRDLNAALMLVQEGQWPVAGPAIAHRFSLGPVWFLLLALPIALGGGWLSVALFSGALYCGQYPLARHLGRRLAGRAGGLAACAMLAFPGWLGIYDWVFTHTGLIPVTALLALLAMAAWWQRGRHWRLFLAGLAVSLALHAHVSTIALLVALLVLAAWRHRSRPAVAATSIGIALAGAVVPMLPYIVHQLLQGGDELAAGLAYGGRFHVVDNLLAVPLNLRGVLLAGPLLDARWVAGLTPPWHWLPVALMWLLLAAAGAGLWLSRRRSGRWTLGLCALAALALALASLRNIMPNYQAFTFLAVLALLFGLGLAGLPPRLRASALVASMALALATQALNLAGVARFAAGGLGHVPDAMAFDLRTWRPAKPRARWWLPAWSRDALGRYLCRSETPRWMLGHLAGVIESSSGLERRWHCPQRRAPLLLQRSSGEGPAVVGLVRDATQALDLRPVRRIGPLDLYRPQWVAPGPRNIEASDGREYPPWRLLHGAKQSRRVTLTLGPGELLWAVNALHVFMPDEQVAVNADAGLERVWDDGDSYAWRCRGCAGSTTVRLTVRAPDPAFVQVFTVTGDNRNRAGQHGASAAAGPPIAGPLQRAVQPGPRPVRRPPVLNQGEDSDA